MELPQVQPRTLGLLKKKKEEEERKENISKPRCKANSIPAK
jgi:hypothetical protein